MFCSSQDLRKQERAQIYRLRGGASRLATTMQERFSLSEPGRWHCVERMGR